MRALGAELIEHGEDFQTALEYSRHLAAEQGLYAMPSMDAALIPGVATYALEFFRHAPLLDVVYVPIGMGSGICGVMAARDALRLRTRVVGVVSDRARCMLCRSPPAAPCRTPSPPISPTASPAAPPDDKALHYILRGADRVVQVSDTEVGDAMRALSPPPTTSPKAQAPPGSPRSSASATASVGQRAGIILSGSNVDRDMFTRVLAAV